MRATELSAIPCRLRSIAKEGHTRFGNGSAAWEIPDAVAPTLELGRRDNVAKCWSTSPTDYGSGG